MLAFFALIRDDSYLPTMTVILWLIGIVLALGVLFLCLMGLLWLFGISGIAVSIATAIWPAISGLILCVVLWRGGHDDAGVVLFLASIIVSCLMFRRNMKAAEAIWSGMERLLSKFGF